MSTGSTVPETIVCIDCGGRCGLLGDPRADWQEGDVASYRCAECHDRWDIVVEGLE